MSDAASTSSLSSPDSRMPSCPILLAPFALLDTVLSLQCSLVCKSLSCIVSLLRAPLRLLALYFPSLPTYFSAPRVSPLLAMEIFLLRSSLAFSVINISILRTLVLP